MELKLNDTLNSAWKNDKSRFGFKMLQKMGWKEDKGLGKNDDGITANIKAKKREAGLGLGVELSTDDAGNKGWNETATSYNEVLQMLNQSYKRDKITTKKTRTKISCGMK